MATAAAPLDKGKAKSVLRQVEFYFSDSNLPRDKFLRETVEQSDDGLVSLALICSFSRMKSHLGLDKSVKQEAVPEEIVLAVAAVLRRSPLLRVSEDGKRIGRATELLEPDEIIEQVESRTIAASPLPYNVKLEDVKSFFAQHAKVNSVRLPRHIGSKRCFCGTSLVEFSEEEKVQSVMENNLVFAGANLEIKPKLSTGVCLWNEFDAEREFKREEYGKSHPVKDEKDEGYPKGLILAFKLKKTMVDGAGAAQESNTDIVAATKADSSKSVENPSGEWPGERILDSTDLKEQKTSDETDEEKEVNTGETTASGDQCTDGALAESENDGASGSLSRDSKTLFGNVVKPISREDLKGAIKKFGTVRYVDFSIGDDSGYLRFEDSKAAERARVAAALADEGGLIIKGHTITLEPVTGEAEKDYWNKIRSPWEKSSDKKSYQGRTGNNYRGRKQFNGKRSQFPDSADNVSNKAQKVGSTA